MTSSAETRTPARTVGVFDSGFGGLTVLRALLPRLPGTHFVYLGDTARLPYGAKSQATVARYAVEAARFLVGQGADLLVIACNTATALALPEIRAAVRIPVVGVIEPGAMAAQAAFIQSIPTVHKTADAQTGVILGKAPHAQQGAILSHEQTSERRTSGFATSRAEGMSRSSTSATPTILVLATAATVASHAYRDTCATFGLDATEMPCPLLVSLVEEGWTDHPITRDVLRIYLSEALSRIETGSGTEVSSRTTPDAVLLGCTHYPLIAPLITQTLRDLGCQAPVIDSAEATAEAARRVLYPDAPSSPRFPSSAQVASPDTPALTVHAATFTSYATDSIEKFARLGSHFLGQPIPEVHLLDLGG